MSQKKIYRPQFATATDARVVQTRQALRGALLELLNEKSLDQITIREIAAKAGVGYTTFFRHHPGKDELLDDIAADEIRKLIELALPALDSTDTMAAARALCGYVDQHRTLWSTLLTGGAASKLREEFVNIARDVAVDRGKSGDWLPAEAAVVLVASSTIELLAWWLKQKQPLSAAHIAEIYERIVVGPVVTANVAR